MRKIIRFILFSSLLCEAFSCKKKEITSVKVTVFDLELNKVVQYTKVYLYSKHKKTVTTGSKDEFDGVWDGYTDVNGQKDFGEFDTYESSNYDYYVTTSSIMNGNDTPFNKIIEKGTANNIMLIVSEHSILTINFNPSPPYGSGDTLRVDFVSPSNISFHGSLSSSYYYDYVRSFSIVSGLYYFNINKLKNGIYTNLKDTVFYDVNSNYDYNINW